MLRILIIIIFLIIAFTLYNQGSPMQKNLPQNLSILAFGDSITQGYGVSKGLDYPSQLEKILNVTVINEGIPGEISAEGLQRLPSLLKKYNPDILVICHGGNDILQKLNLEKTQKNIENMIELAQNRGIKTYLVGVPQFAFITLKTASFYYDIASKYSIPLEDESLEDILLDPALKIDQVHPNRQGYEIMSQNISNLILKNY